MMNDWKICVKNIPVNGKYKEKYHKNVKSHFDMPNVNKNNKEWWGENRTFFSTFFLEGIPENLDGK